VTSLHIYSIHRTPRSATALGHRPIQSPYAVRLADVPMPVASLPGAPRRGPSLDTKRTMSQDRRPRLKPRTKKRTAFSLIVAAPLLFGAPVILGVATSAVRLIGTRYPYLNWATAVNSDAEELYLGHTLYQNPAHGYTGQIYTPLFPTIVSLFDHIYLWNGWPLVAVLIANALLVGLAARVAYARASVAPRVAAMLGAIGIGAIAYWCVSSISVPVLDEGRADEMAWAFSLIGLLAVADFRSAPSKRRVLLAALLLSAAFWTKQTTFGAILVACAWVAWLAHLEMLDRKRAVLFLAVIVGLNSAVLVGLNLLTDGWEFYINFEMATRHSLGSLYGRYLGEGLQSTALALAFVCATWIACGICAVPRRHRSVMRQRWRLGTADLRDLLDQADPTPRRLLLLGLYAPIGFLIAVYFMRKQGSGTNQFVGVAWTLGLLAAGGWNIALRRAGTAMIAGAAVTLCFVLIQFAATRQVAANARVAIPSLDTAVQWPQVPPALISWAKDHTFYSPEYPDLNVPNGGPLYPDFVDFADLLAAGEQPLYLVHALLDRRFDGVELIPLAEDPYTSAYGKWEENYLWKLDEVITARYAPEPGLPPGVLGRRPGPEQDAWMRDCFGPFLAGGASFRIRHGGGFWCSLSPEQLQLVEAPVPLSEVVTTQPVRVSGTIELELEGQPSRRIALELEADHHALWTARIAVPPGNSRDLLVSTYARGSLLGKLLVPAGRLPGGLRSLRLQITPGQRNDGRPVPGSGAGVELSAPAVPAALALVATPGVAVDLDGASLKH
jgi:hypothetical protein